MNIRTIFIVDPKFQIKFILKNLLLLLITFVMLFGALKVWEKYQVNQGFLLRPPTNSSVVAWARQNNVPLDSADFLREFIHRAQVYTFFDLLWKPMLLILLINILILIVANIYYSHKIIGPIHRLKNELERKLSGEEIPAIRFRKNDPFQELAELINKVLKLK
jgi:methyl-accepting chemotaxis protein